MQLKLIVDGQMFPLEIPESIISEAESFFAKMDKDMDGGWQMGPDWIEDMTAPDRCLVAADKLYGALHTENQNLAMLMSAYILKSMPGIESIDLDVQGELRSSEINFHPGHGIPTAPASDKPLTDKEAMEQAAKEISAVYKVGRKHRFSVLNRETGDWVETTTAGTEEEANTMRFEALRDRMLELLGQ